VAGAPAASWSSILRQIEDRRDAAAKGYRLGTERVVPPAATLARMRPLQPIFGITRIANVTGLDRVGIPVVIAHTPNGRSLSVHEGKGLDVAAASASAVMEAVECYHAERVALPLRFAAYDELAHDAAVSGEQLVLRDRVFDPFERRLWVEGCDLLRGRAVWLPYDLVHLDFSVPGPPGAGCFPLCSTGLAAGNTLLEAVAHALCELVERDAVSLWSLAGPGERAASRIDLGRIDDPACRGLLDTVEAAGLAVAVWDATSDIGVPTFVCRIVERDHRRARPWDGAAGAGCHPVPDVALARAVTEALQARLVHALGLRDDLIRHRYRPASRKDRAACRVEVLEGAARRDIRAIASFESDSFRADVRWLIDRLRWAGIREVVAVDLTRPEFGVPAVRVVAPDLEDVVGAPGRRLGLRGRRALAARP
jgi:ribosomal protein S12 methylthiotransferase accessory factor